MHIPDHMYGSVLYYFPCVSQIFCNEIDMIHLVVQPFTSFLSTLEALNCLCCIYWHVVVCDAEIDDYYSDVRYDRIAILNALGAYYSNIGKIEIKQREKEEFFIRATHYYNKASRIDMHEPSTWVGKGLKSMFPFQFLILGS